MKNQRGGDETSTQVDDNFSWQIENMTEGYYSINFSEPQGRLAVVSKPNIYKMWIVKNQPGIDFAVRIKNSQIVEGGGASDANDGSSGNGGASSGGGSSAKKPSTKKPNAKKPAPKKSIPKKSKARK